MKPKRIQVKSFADFKNKIEDSSSLKEQFIENPIKFLNEITDVSPINDKRVFLRIVYIVGAALLLCILVGIAITLYSPTIEIIDPNGKEVTQIREIDTFFIMIASASIGALAGLLAPASQ